MLYIFAPYKNLIFHIALPLSVTFILTILRVPIRFLEGLFTYILPENVGNDRSQSGIRAAIRRPESTESSDSGIEGYQNLSSSSITEPKKRNRSKEKFEFDENNAQIFRLQLVDNHIQSRLYFTEYRDAFVCCLVAISSLLLCYFLPIPENSGIFINGSVIPILLGFIAICKVFVSISKLSFEISASKRSEKQLSIIVGILGFLLVFLIVSLLSPYVFDFDFVSIDRFGKVFIALFAGCLTGFLFMPATKSARTFWLGTDQLRWNLSIISCRWFARLLLYINFLVVVFTSLLWIKPIVEIFIKKRNFDTNGINEKLVGNMGMAQLEFVKLRLLCLLVSGISQIVSLRPNLQMYLDEAVLCWYQRLHASKVPDLDFSRAKIFLHNYYLCLVVLQFFAPAALILIFLGLSQIEGNLLGTVPFICSFVPCSAFVKEVALFMAWWVVFVWAIVTSSSLVFYRCGFLYVS